MKIEACVFPVSVGAPQKNAEKMIEIARQSDSEIILFPAMAVSGASCESLFRRKNFVKACDDALEYVAKALENEHKFIFTSNYGKGNLMINKGAVLYDDHFLLDGEVTVSVGTDQGPDSEIILLPSAMFGYPCIRNDILETCTNASSKGNKVFAFANCGYGESSSFRVYKGMVGIFKNGMTVDFKSQDEDTPVCAKGATDSTGGLVYRRGNNFDVARPYYERNRKDQFLEDLFLLQTQALYTRLKASKIEKIVLGVSGGLDSTLALLVADAAMKALGLPSENIYAVKMPGFGTSARTRENSAVLINELNVSCIEIPINDSVEMHLKDISYQGERNDVVFENAQARERTQILFDLSNKLGALVLGTGDLSEAALGFCTFAGDHFSGYNINATVPKTVIKDFMSYYASKKHYGCSAALASALNDIAATPISPELIEGQQTEDIVGPYELLDFYIYCFAKGGFSKAEILEFSARLDGYSEAERKKWLDSFYRRFLSSRFKRAGASEGANLIGYTLPDIPPDADVADDLL